MSFLRRVPGRPRPQRLDRWGISSPEFTASQGEEIPPQEKQKAVVHCRTTALAYITGLAYTDEAIELGMLLFAFDRTTGAILGIVDEYVGLREPTVPISPAAQAVHGISLQQLRGQRLDHDRVELLLTQAEFLIAHNVAFDRRFLTRLSDTAAEKPWLCSMAGVDWRTKGCRSRKLQDLRLDAVRLMPAG